MAGAAVVGLTFLAVTLVGALTGQQRPTGIKGEGH
jgi:hypothetical protein